MQHAEAAAVRAQDEVAISHVGRNLPRTSLHRPFNGAVGAETRETVIPVVRGDDTIRAVWKQECGRVVAVYRLSTQSGSRRAVMAHACYVVVLACWPVGKAEGAVHAATDPYASGLVGRE